MKQYVHSVYFENTGDNGNTTNYIVINEKDSETGESKLVCKKNLERPVWITKEPYRQHSYKKEYEHLNKLDTYMVTEHEKWDACFEILYGFKPKRRMSKNNFKSPFTYGVDIEASVLIKTAYLDNNNDSFPQITFGAADIETSLLGNKEIIVFTFVNHDWKVFTAVYQPFLEKPNEPGQFYTLSDIEENTKKELIDYLHKYNTGKPSGTLDLTYEMLDIQFFISDNELDLIKWVFSKIHLTKPDLCGFWNMGFDMEYIVDRINKLGGSLTDVMCHPDVPEEFKYAYYKKDTKDVEHITLSWHNMFISGFTRFVDSMALYSRKRTVEGRDVSYKLQDISEKELNIGKMEMKDGITYHPYLQKNCFLDYIAYNICDNLPIVLMEYKNGDMMTLVATTDNSLIEHYAFQSIRLTNSFYRYCKPKKYITCSADQLMKTAFCSQIPSTGGMVFDPTLTRDTAVPIIDGYDQAYGFHKFVSDIDATAIYPTIAEICNTSKETKLSTCLDITGQSKYLIKFENEVNAIKASNLEDKEKHKLILQIKGEIINNLFLHLIATKENAVKIGCDYFNLPNYTEMLPIYLNLNPH